MLTNFKNFFRIDYLEEYLKGKTMMKKNKSRFLDFWLIGTDCVEEF